MYCITEQQIEYILSDIRRNGVEKEDLQFNLLDHICCILEQELKETDDFELVYRQTVRQFYKTELREIEDETINLLTFKNYYAMKKIMITAGGISAAAFFAGSLFKFMFWPGAAVLLCLAMLSFSLLFMPLMVALKVREKGPAGEKLVTAAGALTAILFCMSTLFKIMHWPGANVMLFATMGTSAFLYIPAYFITGIRNPERKLNTIVTSVMMVSATGLLFALVALRPPLLSPEHMANYYNNEVLLKSMQRRLNAQTPQPERTKIAAGINNDCEQLKKQVLENATGQAMLTDNFKEGDVRFFDRELKNYFWNDGSKVKLLEDIKAGVVKYNAAIGSKEENKIPASLDILNVNSSRKATNAGVLEGITQLQMYVVNAEQDGERVAAN